LASNDQYITYPLTADARDLMQRCFDYMAAKFPGWEPSEGQLDVAILEAVSSEAADIASLTTEVTKSIYRYFGAKLMGIIPEDAVAATATSTWVMIDNLGHIIPDGTQVTLYDSTGNAVPFVTLGDVQVPAGNTSTAVGEVLLVAVVPGSDSTNVGSVGGTPTLVDILPFVDHIVQATVSVGGQDAESDDDYLNRLSQELQLIAPRPILPRDFATMARNVAGVQRATAIDGYNPADHTSNNQRMVTVVSLDNTGAAVSSTIKTAVQTYLQAFRETNFVVNVDDPTLTAVDVTVNVLLANGYGSNDVQFRVQQAINDFLDPSTWGIDPSDDPNDPSSWNNLTVVKYLELASAISAVPGVAYIISLAVGLNGGAQASTDHTLTGSAPLPHAGTITVTVSLS
jgi:uncharacterized phage protein gp47/JayE